MASISHRAEWESQFDYMIPPRARTDVAREDFGILGARRNEREDYLNVDRQVQAIRTLSMIERNRSDFEPSVFLSLIHI